MHTPLTRRGFVAAAATTALALVRVPGALAAPTASRPDAPGLALLFCEGENIEHQEILMRDGTEPELQRFAEHHAGTALTWEEGETEGDHPFASHPHRVAWYHLVDRPTA